MKIATNLCLWWKILWKPSARSASSNEVTAAGMLLWWKVAWFFSKHRCEFCFHRRKREKRSEPGGKWNGNLIDRRLRGHRPLPPVHLRQVCTTVYRGEDSTGRRQWVPSDREFHTICTTAFWWVLSNSYVKILFVLTYMKYVVCIFIFYTKTPKTYVSYYVANV